jgi:hypothetical protein
MIGIKGGRPDFYVTGYITSAYVIPEPATVFLLGFGFILIRKRFSKINKDK